MSELAHQRTFPEDFAVPAPLLFEEEVASSGEFAGLRPELQEKFAAWQQQGEVHIDDITAELDGLEVEPEDQALVFDLLEQLSIPIIVPDSGELTAYIAGTDSAVAADLFDEFRKQAGSHKLLSAEEEKILAFKIEQGNQAAKEEFMRHNYKLVMKLSRMYENKGVERIDLVQEGMIGLSRAVEKFDWRKGYKFSTYATWWVRQGMQRAVMDSGANIRLPIQIHERQNKIRRVTREWEQKKGYEPDLPELVAETGYEPRHIVEALATPSTVSADKPVSEEEGSATLLDFISSPEDTAGTAIENSARDALRLALSELTEEEQDILTLRFGLDGGDEHSHVDISSLRQRSKETVRQIESRALGRLAMRLEGHKELLIDDGVDLKSDSRIVDDETSLEFVTADGKSLRLTVTEANIMRLVTAGLSYEEINKATGLANGRVKAYAASAYGKLLGSAGGSINGRQNAAINNWLMLKQVKETGSE